MSIGVFIPSEGALIENGKVVKRWRNLGDGITEDISTHQAGWDEGYAAGLAVGNVQIATLQADLKRERAQCELHDWDAAANALGEAERECAEAQSQIATLQAALEEIAGASVRSVDAEASISMCVEIAKEALAVLNQTQASTP